MYYNHMTMEKKLMTKKKVIRFLVKKSAPLRENPILLFRTPQELFLHTLHAGSICPKSGLKFAGGLFHKGREKSRV